MHVKQIPFGHLYLPGFLAVLLGLIAITSSIQWLQSDPNPDGWMVLWIVSFSIVGAFLFQMGIGFCMAWIMVSNTSIDAVTRAQESCTSMSIASAGEKRKQADGHVQTVEHIEEANVSGVDRDFIPFDLNAKYSRYYLVALGCLALAASLQLASAVTRLYDENGVLAMGTWKCGTAIAATIAHLLGYLVALYFWCKALKLNDMRILAKSGLKSP